MNFVSKQYAFILLASCLACLALLLAFQAIFVVYGNGSSILYSIEVQRTREQAIVKDALLLQSSNSNDISTAVSQLQDLLPLFEKTQKGLVVGDTSLGLPSNIPSDVQNQMQIVNPQYIAIDVAARYLLNHWKPPVNTTQIDIIKSNDADYAQEMAITENLWTQQINGAFFHIFLIDTGLTLLTMLIVITKYIFITRHLFKEQPMLPLQDKENTNGS